MTSETWRHFYQEAKEQIGRDPTGKELIIFRKFDQLTDTAQDAASEAMRDNQVLVISPHCGLVVIEPGSAVHTQIIAPLLQRLRSAKREERNSDPILRLDKIMTLVNLGQMGIKDGVTEHISAADCFVSYTDMIHQDGIIIDRPLPTPQPSSVILGTA